MNPKSQRLPSDTGLSPGIILGWREMISLPDLPLGPIPAKVDTGARTSTLHATHIEQFEEGGSNQVRFRAYGKHGVVGNYIEVTAPLHDIRAVKNSGGGVEKRLIIRTRIQLAHTIFLANLTLADRKEMRYPMLLGRTALQTANLLVDCRLSYVHYRSVLAGTRSSG